MRATALSWLYPAARTAQIRLPAYAPAHDRIGPKCLSIAPSAPKWAARRVPPPSKKTFIVTDRPLSGVRGPRLSLRPGVWRPVATRQRLRRSRAELEPAFS